MKYYVSSRFLLCWFRNTFCCRVMLLECLRSITVESHGLGPILQLCAVVQLSTFQLSTVFCKSFPRPHPATSAPCILPLPRKVLKFKINHISRAVPCNGLWPGEMKPVWLCHCVPSKPLTPVERQLGRPAARRRR